MPMTIRTFRRADLPENGVVTFQAGGAHYVVADIEGEVRAFAVVGPAARDLDRVTIAEGRLRCPMHGWPIDADVGRCGAAELCRYDPLPVEGEGEEIRVALPCPRGERPYDEDLLVEFRRGRDRGAARTGQGDAALTRRISFATRLPRRSGSLVAGGEGRGL